MNILDTIGQTTMDKVQAERPVPRFEAGDTVRVHVKVQEGNRERLQVYEGLCIGRKNAGVNSAFTVRKISFGEGVERVFPLYSPNIWEIEVVRKGVVRRAKLYYLRDLRGKASRIAEDTEAQRELIAEQAEEALKRPRREKLKKEKPKAEGNVRAAKGGAARSRRTMAFRKKAAPPPPPPPRTLFEKIWDAHVVHRQDDGTCVIYIDRHLVHEVTSPQAFEGLRMAGRPVRRTDATIAVADHNTPTTPVGEGGMDEESRIQVETLEKNVAEFGVPYFGMDDPRRGIVHVIGPEQGLTLPGMTIVCGDSHTSTHGAFGALAFGIGTSEVEHVLATQTLIQKPAKNMRVAVEGSLPLGVTAKDVILAIIGKLGTAGGTGYVIEYAGRAIREMTMEGRMTVCNMSIEAGARAGLIAPDETTFQYLEGRPYAPKGGAWDLALGQWRRLPSDKGANFDTRLDLLASDIPPMVTWGTSPQDALPITDVIPDPANAPDENLPRGLDALARLYGPDAGHAPGRRADRPRVHRLVHQRPHRGPARRRRDRARPQGGVERLGHGRAGLRPGEGRGREGRPRQDLPRGGLRMAHPGLLDVPGHERRPARTRPALRLDLEPQLRGPAGPRRAHPSGEPGDGRRRGHPRNAG